MLRYGMGLAILEKSLLSAESVTYLELSLNKKLSPDTKRDLNGLDQDIEALFSRLSNYSPVMEYEETYLHFKAAYQAYKDMKDGQNIRVQHGIFKKELDLGKAQAPPEYKTSKKIIKAQEID